MASQFPYVASAGPLISTMQQLRKSFPDTVSADTLKKWGLAPKNESYVLNVLRYLGFLSEDGKKQPSAKIFNQDNSGFSRGLEKLIKESYAELFELHNNDAWSLDQEKLVTYFRTTDDSSSTVGKRQAGTFKALAALAGHGDIPQPAQKLSKSNTPKKKTSKKVNPPKDNRLEVEKVVHNDIGLTVRIEVNLPASDDQKVYDAIFKSMRENLIDGR